MRKRVAIWLVVGVVGMQAAAAWAAESGDQGNAIEEIVITAQKRTERLADVPVSASVVSTEELVKLNIGDISDLNRVVPSVNLNGTINGRVPYGIRGISTVSNEFTVGVSQGVAVMIDGVPIPSDSRAGNAIEDVQSIEVLKGPQQTFGGRAAASGIINIVTRRPTDQRSAMSCESASPPGCSRRNSGSSRRSWPWSAASCSRTARCSPPTAAAMVTAGRLHALALLAHLRIYR
mgnify:CR=1 FL=1